MFILRLYETQFDSSKSRKLIVYTDGTSRKQDNLIFLRQRARLSTSLIFTETNLFTAMNLIYLRQSQNTQRTRNASKKQTRPMFRRALDFA